MSESLCLNDGSLGPGVRGCRGDFDFTQKFERIFLQIIPAAVFVAAAFARVVVLSQRSRIVGGLFLQSLKAGFLIVYSIAQLVTLILVATGTHETIPKTRWIHWNADEHSPEESSSVLSLGVYAWLNKLFLRGYRDVMDIDDLYPLDEGMTAGRLYSRFEKKIRTHKYPNEPNSGLLKDLCRTLTGPFLYPVAPRIALIAFKFCQPFFIDATLEFLQLPETSGTNNIGYGLIGAVFLIYSGIAVSFAFYGYYRQKALTMIRGCLCAVVYRKTTEMKLTSADDSAALTLMSTDIDRVLHGAESAHELWANTIEVSVGCWLLYNKVGVAFVSPLVIIVISGAILGWILALVGKRQNEWMERIQNRVGLTANAISHMKLYKISGITGPVADLIQSLRVGELKIGNSFRLLLILAAVLGFAPLALSPVVTLAFTSASLGVSTIFTSLSYIFLLSSPLINMFQNLPRVLAGVTCTTRIQKFLVVESRTDFRNRYNPQSSSSNSEKTQGGSEDSALAFSVENGFFGWGGEKTTLNQIDCFVPAHKLTIVVGEVASGKTTFCKALLGEVPVSSGTIKTFFPSSRIGYCEQTPFLYNATFKENIIGHCAFDQKKYDEIIDATMLSVDVALLPQGHNTKIGSNGIMLSGGQKQRVSVARALYSEADVMIFDDVLSGLDNDTEAELFRRVYGPGGITCRRNVTVVICTHSVRHLPTADHIIALGSGGTVIEQGTFSELMENNKYVHSLGVKHGGTDTPSTVESVKEQTDTVTVPSSRTIKTELDDKSRQQGDWSIYTHYFKSVGFGAAFTVIFAGIMFGVTSNVSSVWLKFWSEDTFNRPAAFLRTELHKRAITTVVAAPLRFFTTTDSGIVTNLFSQDMTLLDNDLPLALTNFTLDLADSMGMAAVIASASPYLAAGYPFLFIILYFVQKVFICELHDRFDFWILRPRVRYSKSSTSVQHHRLTHESTHFIDTIKGVATIRAFGWQDLDISHNNHLLDTSQRPAYLLGAIQQWLISTLHLVVTGLAVLLIALSTQMRSNAGITGASLISLLSFSDSVTNLIRSYTLLETSLGAVARLRSFSENVKPEDQPGEDVEPPESWPQSGNIDINDVSASYEPESLNEDGVVIGSPAKLALSNLKLSITPGQKVAICGRTGSGKSTMILLLLRLLDPLQSCSRNIEIDNIPLHQIDRTTLRKRIIAIPQDAVFLPDGSSIKANIDPLNGATESECIQVLETVRLSGFIDDRGGLNAGMSADDLSAGQKQLFSLGRAILRRRVRDRLAGSEKRGGLLLLDEVSSSVDKATDRAMQEIIREEFESYTIVMVSHRLEMVMDFFDRVVVLDKGAVVESGGPRELVDTPGSRFGELWGIEHDDAGSNQ
ncbi:hypothetical protein CEP52_010121 [Fusarium oligoseptatum]|uniref:ABC transporter n=1 Tax=Fusarium oligoseptatum TaxID=2604345 RepID=A0A428TA02_9HYPO|nr:hypothetical protein CEP52_010121 [Fusarium oligoseptatum]